MRQPRLETIDCDYLGRQFAASYLRIAANGECAFIENNTVHAVPRLLEALKAAGCSPADVRYLIITHVHLDHAGGTAALLAHCPNATVLAHPRAARHLIDPSRLVAGATAVYGVERFEKLYGKILPVPAERVRSLEDDAVVSLGADEPLRFLHLRGHAKHHFVVHDEVMSTVYTGDAFGVAYPRLQREGVWVFPSTSPTDFEPEEAIQAVHRIAALGTRRVHLTHFGEVTAVTEAAQQLEEAIQFHAVLRDEAKIAGINTPQGEAQIVAALRRWVAESWRKRGLVDGEADWDVLRLDLEVNAQGLRYSAFSDR